MASKRAPQERAVTWHGTGDPLAPYEADVDGETWLVSVNDFPDEPMYTLFVDDREIESFDNWPSTWRRPSFASQFGEKLASLLRPRAGAPAAAGKPVPVPKQEPVPVPAWAWPTDSSRLRVRYQYGNEHSPTDPIGRVVVDLQTSSVRLDNWRRSLGGHHAWQARVAPAVMDKIVSFLVDGGFPRPLYATQRGFPPDTTFRTLELTDDGQKAAVFMAWDDAAKNPAYGMVFKLLDAMVGELTGGRIPSPPVRESPLVRNVEPIALDPEADPAQQHRAALLWHKEHTVRKRGEKDYELLCAVCGAAAMRFQCGPVEASLCSGSPNAVQCTGITGATSFSDENPRRFFDHLAAGAIPNAHGHARNALGVPGLDAYCPECDRIYCALHYSSEDVFDEGFYDCTYGTCPKGHRRMIGD